jgi:hypothetical protein
MKKSVKTLAMSASLLALAGAAHAATYDINLYGASAQYTYWSAVAKPFLEAAPRSCTVSTTASNGSNQYIAIGTNCNGGTDTIRFRVASKASYDGILAVSSNSTHPNADLAQCGAGNPGQRKMADEAQITGTTLNGLKCVDVNIGASDVAGSTFTQSSHGNLLGPRDGGNIDRVFNKIPTTGLTPYQPIVVPFGFFVNSAVKVSKCVGGSHDGNLCTSTADCGGSACTPRVLDNITKEMAVSIFNGSIAAWTDFGPAYSVDGDPSNSLIACLRHAGSGTAASLDYAVMRGTGASVIDDANNANGIVFFNDGSSDEIKCVNGNSTIDYGFGVNATGALVGAIGYADADQAVGVSGTSQNVTPVKYNGSFGRNNTIKNGMYDFFSNQWLYENPAKTPASGGSDNGATHNLIIALKNYASNPANLASVGSKGLYWAAGSEMLFNKTADNTYPLKK